MNHDNDYANIQAYLATGDPDAFERLYQRYRRPLFTYLNRMLPGQAALVDDLYQQIWLKVLANLQRYNDRQCFSGWLFRIAHNIAVDHFRRCRGYEYVALDPQLPDAGVRPGDQIEQTEFDAALASAIAVLPSEQREVVCLRRQGVSFKQIAELQQTTVNTALGRMHYAIKKLQSCLAEFIQPQDQQR